MNRPGQWHLVKIIDRDELRADNLTIIELQRGQPVVIDCACLSGRGMSERQVKTAGIVAREPARLVNAMVDPDQLPGARTSAA